MKTQLELTQDALSAAIASLIDLVYGWSVKELHEPPKLTVQRALRLLPDNVVREIVDGSGIPKDWLED